MGLIKSTISATVMTLVLAGCGGSGSEAALPRTPIDHYVGRWIGCEDYEKMTVTIAKVSEHSLSLSLYIEYFTNATCSGTAAGSLSTPTPFMELTYQHTDIILLEDPLTYEVQLVGLTFADVFHAAAKAGSITLTGNLDVDNCIVGTGFCFGGLSYDAVEMTTALHLTDNLLTPINFVNSTSQGSGKWYSDEIAWTKVD